jgi:hypothetical protein
MSIFVDMSTTLVVSFICKEGRMKIWRFTPGKLKVGSRVVKCGASDDIHFTVTSVAYDEFLKEWQAWGVDSQGRNCGGRQADLLLTSRYLDPKATIT